MWWLSLSLLVSSDGITGGGDKTNKKTKDTT